MPPCGTLRDKPPPLAAGLDAALRQFPQMHTVRILAVNRYWSSTDGLQYLYYADPEALVQCIKYL